MFFSNLSYCTGTFLVGAHWFGFHFQNCKHFLEYFGFWLLNIVYTKKTILGILVNLFISKNKTTKVNFRFYEQCSQDAIRLICEQPFLRKILVSFYRSNIPVYIEKNPVEKSCNVLEMEKGTLMLIWKSPYTFVFIWK